MKRMLIVCGMAVVLAGCHERDGATGAPDGYGNEAKGVGGQHQGGTLSDKNDSPIGRTGSDTNATGPGTRGGSGSATGSPNSDAPGSGERTP